MGKHLIVGLGNPGPRYDRTRHNMGFMAVDAYAARLGARFARSRFGQVAEVPAGWLLKPETYMNLSGQAVAPFLQYYRLSPTDLLVVADDLDLPLGTLRLRRAGSSGGHNGLKSIIGSLGTEGFARLRMGISRPPEPLQVIDWVLMRFTAREMPLVTEVVDRAVEALETVVSEGLDRAMSQFNG